ncbi:MAG TPA: DNA topoisomerase I [Nitrososphaerales archaeon]|nr:DNA topoisomerase I [Nitrososphaerales archaeon]
MGESSQSAGYTLVICEKPDAARRISEALAGGTLPGSLVEGVVVYRFRHGQQDFVVCSAQGHVYAVSDPFRERAVYPIFDAEWYQSNLVEKGSASAAKRIAAVKKLSGGAGRLVNACDFDVEGETIGFNVLRYACDGREREAIRAKFSTLTSEELVESFRSAKAPSDQGLARAGRARHLVDFMWGVNLSRALSQSALASEGRYRTVSIGRVQGPTLKFVAQRESEIQEFVPTPFWKAHAVFERGQTRFVAAYAKERIGTRAAAEKVKRNCEGRDGIVADVRRSVSWVPPSPPFSIGDLQREAYRAFGFSPSRTLQIAERLYLGSLASYPRTGSQKLPPSINFRGILRGLQGLAGYSREAGELLRGELRPVEGAKADPAHPAIHPTGEHPRRSLDSSEAKVYDMVVRRFLSAFAPAAKIERAAVTIAVEGNEFVLEGASTVYPGWQAYYGRYRSWRDVEVPPVKEGERLRTAEVRIEEKFNQRPIRYNQSSLLEKMEREGIGTKATRAGIISTLLARGYISGESLAVTGLGESIVEIMEMFAPSIVTTGLTQKIEERLEAVEGGQEDGRALLRETVRSITEQMIALSADEDRIGRRIGEASSAGVAAGTTVLGPCPVCKTGKLRIVRSKKTGKRFVGCTNYPEACRASAPLPQRGAIKAAPKPCQRCSWPVVYVLGGRHPWRLCVNPDCPSKVKKRDEVQAV